MKGFLTFAAFALTVLVTPRTAAAQTSNADTLYDAMLTITRHEALIDENGNADVDPLIADIVGSWLPHLDGARDVTAADIEDLLDSGASLCKRKNLVLPSECENIRGIAERLVRREEKTQILGIDLQLLASSFEEPLIGGFALPFEGRVRAINRMWRADIAAGASGSSLAHRIRTTPVKESAALEEPFGELGGILNAMRAGADSSNLAAAVWRYRFAGPKFLDDERPGLPPASSDVVTGEPGTERALLQKRWNAEDVDIEGPLTRIADTLIESDDAADISKGESVFFSFPDAFVQALPGNVRVWAFVERLPSGEVTGDAGLQWVFALQPAPLTLCSEEDDPCVPVLGGSYPPPPVEVPLRPLCTYPIMRAGMLCPHIRQTKGGEFDTEQTQACAQNVRPSDDIQLAACIAAEPVRETDPGGAACADFSWQILGGGEEATQDVCAPLHETTLRSTIGNTVCFLNRCFKQSLQDHRLIPGRVPLTSGESAYPFDLCLLPDPHLGGAIAAPRSETAAWTPEPYRPALLLQSLENVLCPGLPPGDPLCTFDPQRSLDAQGNDLTSLAEGLLNQEQEFQEPGFILRQLSEAIGMRIGTRVYRDLLTQKARGLTDFSAEAALLLEEFTKASFPNVLCPMNLSDAREFCRNAPPPPESP